MSSSSELRRLAVQQHAARIADIQNAELSADEKTAAIAYSEARLTRDIAAANARDVVAAIPSLGNASLVLTDDKPHAGASKGVCMDFRDKVSPWGAK